MKLQPTGLKLILVYPLVELCAEWRQRFAGIKSVSVVNGYVEDITDYDCIVSPGNSFGLMDGGIACPGLGTMTGKMPFNRAAKHMALAYKNFLYPPERISWPYATTRQNAIGSSSNIQK